VHFNFNQHSSPHRPCDSSPFIHEAAEVKLGFVMWVAVVSGLSSVCVCVCVSNSVKRVKVLSFHWTDMV